MESVVAVQKFPDGRKREFRMKISGAVSVAELLPKLWAMEEIAHAILQKKSSGRFIGISYGS